MHFAKFNYIQKYFSFSFLNPAFDKQELIEEKFFTIF
jgi:hypothetical protein